MFLAEAKQILKTSGYNMDAANYYTDIYPQSYLDAIKNVGYRYSGLIAMMYARYLKDDFVMLSDNVAWFRLNGDIRCFCVFVDPRNYGRGFFVLEKNPNEDPRDYKEYSFDLNTEFGTSRNFADVLNEVRYDISRFAKNVKKKQLKEEAQFGLLK